MYEKKSNQPAVRRSCRGIFLCQSASAVVYRQSQIIITGTNNLGTDASTGTAEGWGNTTGNVTVTNGTGSLDGTSLGLVASAGDKVWISATAGLNARNQFATNTQFNVSVAEYTNYYSFLYRFNAGTDVSVDGQTINAIKPGKQRHDHRPTLGFGCEECQRTDSNWNYQGRQWRDQLCHNQYQCPARLF